jgi:hypothetical protein
MQALSLRGKCFHLSPTPALYALAEFSDSLLLLLRLASDHDPPISASEAAGIITRCHCAWPEFLNFYTRKVS